MDVREKICLHDGINTQYLLPKGRAYGVRLEARSIIEILRPQSCFILSPCNALKLDVPVAYRVVMSEIRRFIQRMRLNLLYRRKGRVR